MDNLYEELTDDEDFRDFVQMQLRGNRGRLAKTYRERKNHFTYWNDKDFKLRFRLSKPTAQLVIDRIAFTIASTTNRNHAVSPTDMVLLTLRFLATGSFLQVVGDFCGVDKGTASRAVGKVLRAIAALREDYINMPVGEEAEIVRREFYDIARFPKCIGAIDCTHIKISNPGGPNSEIYRNRKTFFSLNVQVVGDAKLRIRNIVARWPGSAHDSNIFRNSRLKYNFENGVYGDDVLVGDSGYAIKKYLITPLGNPITPAENLFNESQIRTRNPIERLFGVLKRRFPILATGIRLKLDTVEPVVVACGVLHNIAISIGDEEIPFVNEEIESAVQITNHVNDQLNCRNIRNINTLTRDVLIQQYFPNFIANN